MCCVCLGYFTTPITYFFFFNDTATTEIYTLSLHDALPICDVRQMLAVQPKALRSFGGKSGTVRDRPRHDVRRRKDRHVEGQDRKSTRLNSSHSQISYAVFCLKKKKIKRRLPSISH